MHFNIKSRYSPSTAIGYEDVELASLSAVDTSQLAVIRL